MKKVSIIVLVLLMAICIGGIVSTWMTDFYTETPTENGEIVAVYLPAWFQIVVKIVATVIWTGAFLCMAIAIHRICIIEIAVRLEKALKEAKELDEFYNNLRGEAEK